MVEEEYTENPKMPVFIDLTTDFGFKRVFKRKEFMISFINSLLKTYNKSERVTDVIYLNTEEVGEVHKDRRIVFDLKCKTQDGDFFIVEMQKRGQEYFDDRIIYYMCRSIATQGEAGDELWKFGVKKVYGIFMMNFNEKRELAHRDIRHCGLYDYTNGCEYSDKQDFWLVNLPQYRKYKREDCKTDLEKWLYIISNSNKMKTMPFMREMPVFKGLKTATELAQMSPDERDTYMWEFDAHRTDLAAYDYAIKEGFAQGEAQGMEQGMKQGMEQGMKQGIEQGIEQGMTQGAKKQAIETALRMLEKGFDSETIVQLTGLTFDEIAAL